MGKYIYIGMTLQNTRPNLHFKENAKKDSERMHVYNASVQISDSLPIEQLQFNSLIIFYEIESCIYPEIFWFR